MGMERLVPWAVRASETGSSSPAVDVTTALGLGYSLGGLQRRRVEVGSKPELSAPSSAALREQGAKAASPQRQASPGKQPPQPCVVLQSQNCSLAGSLSADLGQNCGISLENC